MKGFLIYFIISMVVLVVTMFLIKRKSPAESDTFEGDKLDIRLSKMVIAFGIVVLLLAGFVISISFPVKETDSLSDIVGTSIMIGFLAVVGLICIIVPFIWKIQLIKDADYFVYKSVFGISRKVKYEDCENYKPYADGFLLKTKKKKFYIDVHAQHLTVFLKELANHNVKKIDTTPVAPRKLR